MRSSWILGRADALSGYLARASGRSRILQGLLLAAERVSRGFGEGCFSRMGEGRLAHRIALRDRGRLGAVGGFFLRVPELLLLLLLALFPFLGFFAHPTLLLLGGTLLLEVAFLGKYLHGRRTVRMGYLQMLVLLLALLFALGGAVGYGGGATLADGLARALLVLLFFPVSSLLESRLWRRRARRALQGSTALLSLMGILQYCFTEMELKWVDVDRFSSLGGRVSLSFGNPNILASFLLLALPLALGGLTDRTERVGWRIGFGIAAGLEGTCLILTWSRGAWLGAAAGVLFYLLLLGRRARARTLLSLPLIGLSAPLWPSNLLLRLGSIGRLADSSTRYRLYTWKGVLRMLAAHPFGIGSGEAAFRAVYPTYAVSGTETVMHAHNLLLGATAALGLPGAAVLLLLLLLWGLEVLRGCFLLTGENRADLLAPSAGIVSLLVMGCFDDPWYHFGVFAMLWILLALSAAAFADARGKGWEEKDAEYFIRL